MPCCLQLPARRLTYAWKLERWIWMLIRKKKHGGRKVSSLAISILHMTGGGKGYTAI